LILRQSLSTVKRMRKKKGKLQDGSENLGTMDGANSLERTNTILGDRGNICLWGSLSRKMVSVLRPEDQGEFGERGREEGSENQAERITNNLLCFSPARSSICLVYRL
jgi:hypothetical protein